MANAVISSTFKPCAADRDQIRDGIVQQKASVLFFRFTQLTQKIQQFWE